MLQREGVAGDLYRKNVPLLLQVILMASPSSLTLWLSISEIFFPQATDGERRETPHFLSSRIRELKHISKGKIEYIPPCKDDEFQQGL